MMVLRAVTQAITHMRTDTYEMLTPLFLILEIDINPKLAIPTWKLNNITS